MVISPPLDVEDVTVGMVITYHIPIDDHRVVTHRVVSVQHAADGTVTVQTKGDANTAVDPFTAVLIGAMLLREHIPLSIPHLLGYAACLAVVTAGAIRLARNAVGGTTPVHAEPAGTGLTE